MQTSFRSLFALAILLTFAALPAAAAGGQVQGILIDQNNSWKAETRVVGGALEGGILQAYTYTRAEALKPESQKAGYGVVTFEGKYLKFDAAGNTKALALLKASKKEDYLKVEVAGEVQDDSIKVTSIKFIE